MKTGPGVIARGERRRHIPQSGPAIYQNSSGSEINRRELKLQDGKFLAALKAHPTTARSGRQGSEKGTTAMISGQ
ncbi:MAG: hypothetical protein CMJ46_16780 [Planctomyces sp.]|nr:hypothetical protein [Planctomyces sp.]